jgi:hypothetical protein
MSPLQRKIAITLACLVLVLGAYTGLVDKLGTEYTDKGFKRALVTFAIARSLNGVISVAQGTEVALQPAGIGINFTPGQILDPINDLIERFSWVMLASSTSLGLQKLLMTIFSSPLFNLLMVITLALWVLAAWWPKLGGSVLKPILYKTALLLVVVRFTIPLIAVGSELLFSTFLEEQYQSSTHSIETTTAEIGQINRRTEKSLPDTEPDSLVDKALRLYDSATTGLEMDRYFERYKSAAADAGEHAVNLIVIFVLQTVLLPLLFLWMLIRFYKRVIRFNP